MNVIREFFLIMTKINKEKELQIFSKFNLLINITDPIINLNYFKSNKNFVLSD